MGGRKNRSWGTWKEVGSGWEKWLAEGGEQVYPFIRMEVQELTASWQHLKWPGALRPLAHLILQRTMWGRVDDIILRRKPVLGDIKGLETSYILVSRRWDGLDKDGSDSLVLCWAPMTASLQVSISHIKQLRCTHVIISQWYPKSLSPGVMSEHPPAWTHVVTWQGECVLKELGMCLGQLT